MVDQCVYNWYQQYKIGLYRFALSLLKEPQLAEDALQETFVRLMVQKRLPEPEIVQAWLYRVIRNICYDILRKQKREIRGVPSDISSRDHQWQFTELIASLPQKEQEILALRFIGGLSHKEIARVMGLTVHSAKKRYERAIHTLRKEMEVSL